MPPIVEKSQAAAPLGAETIRRVERVATEKAIPLFAHLDLTYRCDLRCVHCYLDEYQSQGLDTAQVLRILDQLADAGTLFVTFSGGEVFVRKDLFEILRHARRRNFFITLKTHGGRITPAIADQMAQLKVNLTMFSVYSLDPAVHDAITTRKGSLARTMRGIALLRERGLKARIAAPIMGDNFVGYRELFEHFSAQGIEVELGTYIMKTRQGFGSQSHTDLTDEQVREIYGFIQHHPVAPGVYKSLARGYKCMAGVKSLYIDPMGGVHPCPMWARPLGDLRSRDFDAIWNNDGIRSWRRLYERDDLASCPAANLTESGDIFVTSERSTKFLRVVDEFMPVRREPEPASPSSADPRPVESSPSGAKADAPCGKGCGCAG
ncbi:MAG: radical SAM protein [Myxococcales bacterium]|nr:radical SAM protein [Myxococcales bacterium]